MTVRKTENLIECTVCKKPLILYEWLRSDKSDPITLDEKPTQGPATHPSVDKWCDGKCHADLFGGGWNERVIRYPKLHDDLPVEMGIHEVHYDKDGKPSMLTVHPTGHMGESIEELKESLKRYERALALPILDWDKDFPKEDKETGFRRAE